MCVFSSCRVGTSGGYFERLRFARGERFFRYVYSTKKDRFSLFFLAEKSALPMLPAELFLLFACERPATVMHEKNAVTCPPANSKRRRRRRRCSRCMHLHHTTNDVLPVAVAAIAFCSSSSSNSRSSNSNSRGNCAIAAGHSAPGLTPSDSPRRRPAPPRPAPPSHPSSGARVGTSNPFRSEPRTLSVGHLLRADKPLCSHAGRKAGCYVRKAVVPKALPSTFRG